MSGWGVVAGYNSERGFGFIKSCSFEHDLFFHIKEFRHEITPYPGMKVAFNLKVGADGKKSACNIRFLPTVDDEQSKEDSLQHQRRSREEKLSNQVYTAAVSVREASDFRKQYIGILKLNERQLQFEGRNWGTRKIITRSLRFITSVDTPMFGPYVITGGGPELHVESTKFFVTGEDLKNLVSALESLI